MRPGDVVGVVLLNHGGPRSEEEVEAFLYNRLLDPAALRLPVPGWMRRRFARALARRQAARVATGYTAIGGESPLNRHAQEQASALERRLDERLRETTGGSYRVAVAMRYSGPSCEDAARRLVAAGATHVLLVPLHPHYASTTTGTSLAAWERLRAGSALAQIPTAAVQEYAAHPSYIQALSDRINEGLQRFASHDRAHVHLVFTAHGAPRHIVSEGQDPYCCLVHSTVRHVLDLRDASDPGRASEVSFHAVGVPGRGLRPSTTDVVEEIVHRGGRHVLLVPITFTSDHVETAYGLDVVERERAVRAGVEQVEVASGLNCHPLFIDALTDVVASRVRAVGGDGATTELPPVTQPRPQRSPLPATDAACRSVRCSRCTRLQDARPWPAEEPAWVAP